MPRWVLAREAVKTKSIQIFMGVCYVPCGVWANGSMRRPSSTWGRALLPQGKHSPPRRGRDNAGDQWARWTVCSAPRRQNSEDSVGGGQGPSCLPSSPCTVIKSASSLLPRTSSLSKRCSSSSAQVDGGMPLLRWVMSSHFTPVPSRGLFHWSSAFGNWHRFPSHPCR